LLCGWVQGPLALSALPEELLKEPLLNLQHPAPRPLPAPRVLLRRRPVTLRARPQHKAERRQPSAPHHRDVGERWRFVRGCGDDAAPSGEGQDGDGAVWQRGGDERGARGCREQDRAATVCARDSGARACVGAGRDARVALYREGSRRGVLAGLCRLGLLRRALPVGGAAPPHGTVLTQHRELPARHPLAALAHAHRGRIKQEAQRHAAALCREQRQRARHRRHRNPGRVPVANGERSQNRALPAHGEPLAEECRHGSLTKEDTPRRQSSRVRE
ncbi:hypothetical protein T484DRAFT_3646900, partial [Baffinella frigidus]